MRVSGKLIRKLILVLLPLLISGLIIGVLQLTDNKGFQVVFKVKLESLIVFIGLLFSGIGLLVWTIFYKHKKSLAMEKLRLQGEGRNEHRRFIQRLDHELKNPLTAIQLSLTNMKSQAIDPKGQGIINDIESQVLRLNKLTTDLRKLTVFDHQELAVETINVADLLSQTKTLCDEVGLTEGRVIQTVLPTAPWPVPDILGDRDLLELALYNLLENAIKYSNDGDHVEIRTYDTESHITIEVADTGLGISESDIDQVFEELFRGGNTRNRSGSGIGLSLVKRIVERHRGELSLTSKDGVGTRITIVLPTR